MGAVFFSPEPSMPYPVIHQCRPPFLARSGNCDCSRCCATGPHEQGCISLERAEQPVCSCPDESDYHQPGCPEYENG